MDELLQQVAEIRGMPASLVERSAQARAEKTGTTVEQVLREWLGEGTASTSATEQTSVPPAEPEPAPDDTAETPPSDAASAPVGMTTDDLVQLASEAKRMPPKLILTSAQARATHAGESLDSVLADWAGVDLDELPPAPAPAPAASEEPAAAEEPTAVEEEEDLAAEPEVTESAVVPVAGGVAVAAMSMDELLEKVAEVKGMPASLAQRSAEARSKKTGEPVEAVLAEWAGVEPGAVSTTPAPAPAPASDENPETVVEEQEQDAVDDVEVIEPAADSPDAAGDIVEETPPARSGYPKWLVAAFLLIPLLAVGYIVVSPNGPDCGSGGQLLVDPATGEAVNCDGSPYGETTTDYFASGGAIYSQCVACHSADGSGGVGPAFTAGAVLETFPAGQCATQIEWVAIGTAGWPDPTYGENNKAVGGVGLMPGFASSLSEEQLASVALYERVQFGGQDLADAEIDCGLVEATDEG
ncbi:MAG: hypothetical protein GWP18_01360 [Proteobacteria bacterium]|nr:hypothetical protein [Pseudomonadota bacterium]